MIEHTNKEKELMQEALLAKFSKWDDVVTSGGVATNEAAGLLRDPTIYAYAFFREKTGEPMKMFYYQDAILNCKHDRTIFAAARQIGKSRTGQVKALHSALTEPGSTIMVVSKTLPQAKNFLREIKEILNSSILDYKANVGDSENKGEIYFTHHETLEDGSVIELRQSRIICVPATEASLGYSVNLLILDELGFYEDSRYLYYQVLLPTTFATKGDVLCLSNPNGRIGVFWELYNNDDFERFRFTFLDCPINTLKEYTRHVKSLNRAERESTLDAIFTDAEGAYFTLEERRAMQEERENELPLLLPQPVYIFFDFAKSKDRTVRGIGVPSGSDEKPGLYVYELLEYPEGTPYNDILQDLIDLVNSLGWNNIAAVGWDNTGVGRGIEDFIKRIENFGILCLPVEYSLENKSRMYGMFKLLAERNIKGEKALKIPYIQSCDEQLAQLRFKRSERSYLKIHHERESDRDDFCDCLCGLISIAVQPDSPPVTATIVGFEKYDKNACEECGAPLERNDDECPNCGNEIEDTLGIV